LTRRVSSGHDSSVVFLLPSWRLRCDPSVSNNVCLLLRSGLRFLWCLRKWRRLLTAAFVQLCGNSFPSLLCSSCSGPLDAALEGSLPVFASLWSNRPFSPSACGRSPGCRLGTMSLHGLRPPPSFGPSPPASSPNCLPRVFVSSLQTTALLCSDPPSLQARPDGVRSVFDPLTFHLTPLSKGPRQVSRVCAPSSSVPFVVFFISSNPAPPRRRSCGSQIPTGEILHPVSALSFFYKNHDVPRPVLGTQFYVFRYEMPFFFVGVCQRLKRPLLLMCESVKSPLPRFLFFRPSLLVWRAVFHTTNQSFPLSPR